MTNEEAIKNLTIVKNLEDALGDFDGGIKNSDLSKSLTMAIEALEQTRWILIGERLPEGFEPVLFTSKNGEIAIGYRDPRFKTYWACIDRADWHHTDFDVVAWMPLPESYQEGEKGGKNEHN